MDYAKFLRKGLVVALTESDITPDEEIDKSDITTDTNIDTQSEPSIENTENSSENIEDTKAVFEELKKKLANYFSDYNSDTGKGITPTSEFMQEFKKAYSDCTEFLKGHPDMAEDEYWLKMKNPIEAILNKDSDESNPDEAIDEEADPEESKIDTLFAEYLKQETADMAQEIEGVYNESADKDNITDYIFDKLLALPDFKEYSAKMDEIRAAKADGTYNEKMHVDLGLIFGNLQSSHPILNKSICPNVAGVIEAKLLENSSSIEELKRKYAPVIAGTLNDTTVLNIAPESRFSGMTVQQIWTTGFKELALINRSLANIQQGAVDAGLSPDLMSIFGGISKACMAIGAVGMLVSSFLPPTPTVLIIRGGFRVLTGVGGMAKSAPKAIKSFKEGDIKTGLICTVGAVMSGVAISSGIHTMQNGISWMNMQKMMDGIINNPDGVIKDLDSRIAKTTDPEKLKMLQDSKASALAFKDAKANGLISDEELNNLSAGIHSAHSSGEMTQIFNGVKTNVESNLASYNENMALSAQDELTAANEYAAQNNGVYKEADLAKYISQRAGTGANGGWLNSTQYPVDPKMEEAARAWANSRPDVTNLTNEISSAKTELFNAQTALNNANAGLDAIKSEEITLDGARLGRSAKDVFSVYGKTDGQGIFGGRTFAIKDPSVAVEDMQKVLSNNTEGMDPTHISAAQALITKGQEDLANNVESPFASVIKHNNDLTSFQQQVADATTKLKAAETSLGASIANERANLNAISNSNGNFVYNPAHPEIPGVSSTGTGPALDTAEQVARMNADAAAHR